MAFQAQFARFRAEDNFPLPVGHAVQVVARTADEAMLKLKRLADVGRWPDFAEAVRLFEDGEEVDSYIPERRPAAAEAA
jgi:hypothetical protein